MALSRLRAVAPAVAVVLFASCSLVCSGVQPPARMAGGGLGDFLQRSGKISAGRLSFPPREDESTARRDLGLASVAGSAAAAEAKKAELPTSPSYIVAGKELGYLPVKGEQRVIAIHPRPETRVGRTTEMSVLFDQPIDLGTAASLVKLTGVKGVTLSSRLAHPIGPTFQGIKVDPRYVVLVRPASPLPSGQEIKLVAADHTSARTPRANSYTVADPLALREVRCGWDSDACSFAGGVLRTSNRTVHVLFNNLLESSGKALARQVRVTPAVKNLSIHSEAWDEGRIVIGGELMSSTTYDVAIEGVVDRFGQRLGTPVRFKVETAPQSASAAMPEGLIVLDEATTKRFVVTTRNLASAELQAWPVQGGSEAFEQALSRVRARTLPQEAAPLRIPVTIAASRDRSVETAVDLSTKLAAGTSYVVALLPGAPAFGAAPMRFPEHSEASRPPVALLGPGSSKALAVHARGIPGATLVHVARLGSGEPVAGATVRFGGDEPKTAVTTAAGGMARLGAASDSEGASLLVVHASDADLILALTDHLPAGFEPIQPDLATVASVPDLGEEHPFSSVLGQGNSASHVELHDDRVELYFDHVSGDEVAATYLVRASTPGEFVLPPAAAELMYEGDSCGYSDAGRVTVQ